MPYNARAFQVERDDQDQNVSKAGAYYFIYRGDCEDPIGVLHGCPCGCGGRSILFFKGSQSGHDEWDVIEDWPLVTLSPSIGIKYDNQGNKPTNGYHWHGYLEDGIFVER